MNLKGRVAKINYILKMTNCFKNDIVKSKECAAWDEGKLDTCIDIISKIESDREKKRKKGVFR